MNSCSINNIILVRFSIHLAYRHQTLSLCVFLQALHLSCCCLANCVKALLMPIILYMLMLCAGVLLTMISLMHALDAKSHRAEITSYLNQLISIDPLRANYYNDLRENCSAFFSSFVELFRTRYFFLFIHYFDKCRQMILVI